MLDAARCDTEGKYAAIDSAIPRVNSFDAKRLAFETQVMFTAAAGFLAASPTRRWWSRGLGKESAIGAHDGRVERRLSFATFISESTRKPPSSE